MPPFYIKGFKTIVRDNTMRGLLVGVFVMQSLALPAVAADNTVADIQKNIEITQQGDLDLGCNDLSRVISAMENVIVDSRIVQEKSQTASTGINVGKAVGSYLVGTLAGGIGIMAAGFLVSEAADNEAEKAEALAEQAMQRRSFIEGVYNAKGCMGPLTLAAIEPAGGDLPFGDISFKEPLQYGPPDLRPVRSVYRFND